MPDDDSAASEHDLGLPPTENDEADYAAAIAEVEAVIESLKAQRRDSRNIGHALIAQGLSHLRGNLCAAHLLPELEYVHRFIGEKLAEVRREMN